MPLEPPGDLPRPTGHLHHHPVSRLKRSDQRLETLRGHRHPARRVSQAFLTDRDHTKIAMQIKTNRATQPPGQRLHLRHNHHLPNQRLTNERETQRDNDTDRYVLAAQSGRVAGAAK